MSAEEEPWTLISDYLWGNIIGEGQFGHVFHGRHKATGTRVAIKVYDRHIIQLTRNKSLLESIRFEQQVLKKLSSHENVVTLYASFIDTQCVYLVLDCCVGGTLADFLLQVDMKGSASWMGSAVSYLIQIWEGLDAIHQHGYVHADLNLYNILLSANGGIRLADFGSSRSIGATVTSQCATSFASPQVLKGNTPSGIADDLWSLGCVVFALWNRKSCFHGTDDEAVEKIRNYCDGNSSFLSQMPPTLRSLVADLLRVDPKLREQVERSNYPQVRQPVNKLPTDTPGTRVSSPETWREANEGVLAMLI